jgi:hypothetical protein
MIETLYKLTRYRMTWYVSGVIDTLLILLIIWLVL